MTVPASYRQWVFARPLDGDRFRPDCLELREVPMPEPAEGQALVKVRLINLHSATRSRMASGMTKLGETDRTNYGCAEVVRSRDPAFREGDVITSQVGWQDWQIVSSQDGPIAYAPPSEAVKAVNRTNSQWCYAFRPELAARSSDDVLMDVFGTSGMTAWFGMRECGPLGPGDVVAVGGTTGSVGSIAAQLARQAGCKVIGFARGEERRRWVREALGADLCLDYTADDLDAAVREAAPDGLDVGSDGVGGAFTQMLVRNLKPGGRLFSYGSSAAYYGDRLAAPAGKGMRAMFGVSAELEAELAVKNIRCEAWIVDAFYQERLAAEDALSAMLASGALKPVNRVVDGFANLPAAIAELYGKPHTGKMQVRF